MEELSAPTLFLKTTVGLSRLAATALRIARGIVRAAKVIDLCQWKHTRQHYFFVRQLYCWQPCAQK
jgi:hypothetical protein